MFTPRRPPVFTLLAIMAALIYGVIEWLALSRCRLMDRLTQRPL
jgi:hypothetical protein